MVVIRWSFAALLGDFYCLGFSSRVGDYGRKTAVPGPFFTVLSIPYPYCRINTVPKSRILQLLI